LAAPPPTLPACPFGTNQSAHAGCRAGLPTWQAHAVKVDANQAIVAARRKRN
jgi:hypothetical protein